MRFFITGATGFIGQATVQELVQTGHQVLGLARSNASAVTIAAFGAEFLLGDLRDHEMLRRAATGCDGVIHLAFNNGDIHGWAEKDRDIVTVFTDALEGSNKALVVSSVVAVVSSNAVATEADLPSPDGIGSFRAPSEEAAIQAAGRGIRSSVIRLPPTVHGSGDQMFLPKLISIAKQTGFSAYVEDGENRWPAVHRLDAARLYRLAAERGGPGERFHAVAEGNIPFRAIAQVIGEKLDVPVRAIKASSAPEQFGWLARFVSMDCPASGSFTQSRLGWRPEAPDLLSDLADGSYF
ncbi:SDR family oxidoreductase [Rhizobium binae]|uniref:SDR family oxidoreductase n=1 Tax=Rhizobium binae TaxID=1138190 RepID=UPI001C8404BC|nr:SDR family oxidoreductase [Rhizobium binae]MBX4967743.1 SDR family oxidoreductase [Rhizobium binae]